jgi:flagellar biosynthetic protein FlhB
MDVGSALSLFGATAVILTAGGWFAQTMATQLLPFIAAPHAMIGGLEAGAGVEIGTRALWIAAPFVGAVMMATILGGVGGSLAQSGLIFTVEKIKPDWSKVNPLSGFGRLFGPDGLVQFLKTFLKLLAVALICWWTLKPHTRELENLAAMSPMAVLPFARDLIVALMSSALVFLGFTAGADYLWQRYRFNERMKMSKEEVKEDFKQTEGDPHVKAKQKQLRQVRARQRMMQAVPQATVVVMNPTHYAVALKYDAEETGAPLCVAKGLDTLALKIREIAEAAGVPVIEDPPLARALYATTEVEEMIPPAHYEAVAKIIGFILNAGKKRVGAL